MKRICISTFLIAILSVSISLSAKGSKTVSILGDSYSTFQGFIEPRDNATWYFSVPDSTLTDVDNVRKTWWHRFIADSGYRLEKNNSFSGATICNTGYEGADFTDRSFITRMDNLGCPDIIIVFGATNDSWADSPLGELKWTDWTDTDLFSFRPALCHMLSHMKDRYINTEIIYLINDILKPEITESIKEACDHYGIRYVMLHDIDKKAGHPTVKGMAQIADQLAKACKTSPP